MLTAVWDVLLAGHGAQEWAWLVLAALCIGVAKTSIGSLANLSVVIAVAVLDAKLANGVILLLLLTGDVLAVGTYHRYVQWPILRRLALWVALGVISGTVYLNFVDSAQLRQAIAVILLCLVAVHLWVQRRRAREASAGATAGIANPQAPQSHSWLRDGGFGSLTGFTTMVANTGGPAMALYLLGLRLPMLNFLGTMSWFFLLVNLFKLPFSLQAGMLSITAAGLALGLAPAVVFGAWLGRRIIHRINQLWFDRFVIISTIGAGLYLLVSA